MALPLRNLPILLAALALAGPALARAEGAEGALEGSWDTAFGRVKIDKVGETYVGRLVEPGRICGYPRGTDVLRGRLEDDFFTGELRVCYVDRCHDDEWALALALAPGGAERLVGSLGPPSYGSCQNQVLRAAPSFVFTRHRAIEAAPLPAPSPAPKRAWDPEARRLWDEGKTYLRDAKVLRAVKKFRAANERDPGNPDILLNLGVALKLQNDLPGARKCFLDVLRIDRNDPEAHYNLACILALEGRASEALSELRIAFRSGWCPPGLPTEDSDLVSLQGVPAFGDVNRMARRNCDRR